jgi:hypothetical protein
MRNERRNLQPQHPQREIEQAVAKARASGSIKGNEKFPASVTLDVPGLKLSVKFDGKIELE